MSTAPGDGKAMFYGFIGKPRPVSSAANINVREVGSSNASTQSMLRRVGYFAAAMVSTALVWCVMPKGSVNSDSIVQESIPSKLPDPALAPAPVPSKNASSFAVSKDSTKQEVTPMQLATMVAAQATIQAQADEHASHITSKHNKSNSEPAASGRIDAAELAKISKADLQTLKLSGYSALRIGNNAYAIPALTQAVRLAPNDALVREYLAYALISEDSRGAVTQFDAYEKLNGTDYAQRTRFASALAGGSNREVAEDYFNQIIQAAPPDPSYLLAIEAKCESVGFKEQAENATLKALKAGASEEQQKVLSVYQKLKADNHDNNRELKQMTSKKLAPGFNLEEFKKRADLYTE
jgi:Flp pilus assembly protein TadD